MKIETQGTGNNLDRGRIRDVYLKLPAGEKKDLSEYVYMVKHDDDGSAQIIEVGNHVEWLIGMVFPF